MHASFERARRPSEIRVIIRCHNQLSPVHVLSLKREMKDPYLYTATSTATWRRRLVLHIMCLQELEEAALKVMEIQAGVRAQLEEKNAELVVIKEEYETKKKEVS
jgi:hypothetical protein